MIKVKRCKRKSKEKLKKIFTRRVILDWIWIACSPATAPEKGLSYQSSYGFASGLIPRHTQGTLLPSSGEHNVQRNNSIK
jgi:hypothetical protein